VLSIIKIEKCIVIKISFSNVLDNYPQLQFFSPIIRLQAKCAQVVVQNLVWTFSDWGLLWGSERQSHAHATHSHLKDALWQLPSGVEHPVVVFHRQRSRKLSLKGKCWL